MKNFSNSPIVSVLMPVHNGGPYIAEAIESILGQDFVDYELIVIDDHSTDDTPDILNEFSKKDPRIKVITQKKCLGLTRSLNDNLSSTKGMYIARHDADDISELHRFHAQVDFLNNHKEYALVGSAATRIDALGNVVAQPIVISGDKKIRSFMKGGNAFVHGSVMMRKNALIAVGGYRVGFRYAQDYDLWLRLSESYLVENLSDRLYRWRVHSAGISDEKLHDQTQFAALANYFATERQKSSKDSYEKIEFFRGNIATYIQELGVREDIDPIIGRLFFRLGNRKAACHFLAHAQGVRNRIYYFLCRNDSMFTIARDAARFIITKIR